MSHELKAKERKQSVVTVEQAAWAVVGLVAAAVRFGQLGLRPLNEGEAVQALAALRFVQSEAQAAPAGTIPALFTANVAGFTLLGASDIIARWLPALSGLILILLPYGLRHRLGRVGALAAAWLLALSPSAVHFSRTLDNASLVAACSLAMVVGLIDYIDTRRPPFLYLAAAACGLGLCSGPSVYVMLLILGAFALLLYLAERLSNRDTGWSALLVAWWAARGGQGLLWRAGAVLGACFGLVATTMVLHPPGIGHAADLIGTWATGFLPEAGGQPAVYLLLLLLRYEPLILLLGLAAAAQAVRGNHRSRRRRSHHQARSPVGSSFSHTPFLIFWALASLLLILAAGHRPAGNILLVVVPLGLLAGQWTQLASYWLEELYSPGPTLGAGLARGIHRGFVARAGMVAGIALGLVVFLYLQVAGYTQISPTSVASVAGIDLPATTSYLLLATVALVLLGALVAGIWFWRGKDLAMAGAWLAALLILGLFGFKAMWGLNFAHASDPRELMLVQTTAPDVRTLVKGLEALSLDKSGDAHTLAVTVDAGTGPVVAWYLREFGRQTVVESLTVQPDTVAAVTLAMEDPPIGETFRGRGFPLRSHALPWGLWGQDLVRWLLFTEGVVPVVDQEVVLWVSSES